MNGDIIALTNTVSLISKCINDAQNSLVEVFECYPPKEAKVMAEDIQYEIDYMKRELDATYEEFLVLAKMNKE